MDNKIKAIKRIKCDHKISLEGMCLICETLNECDVNLSPTVKIGEKLKIELVKTLYKNSENMEDFLDKMRGLNYNVEYKNKEK